MGMLLHVGAGALLKGHSRIVGGIALLIGH
jgi:hypothetical protein